MIQKRFVDLITEKVYIDSPAISKGLIVISLKNEDHVILPTYESGMPARPKRARDVDVYRQNRGNLTDYKSHDFA